MSPQGVWPSACSAAGRTQSHSHWAKAGRTERRMGAWKTSQQAGPPSREEAQWSQHKRNKGGSAGLRHGARVEPRTRAPPSSQLWETKFGGGLNQMRIVEGWGWGKEQDQMGSR